jgi:hypothetical protein
VRCDRGLKGPVLVVLLVHEFVERVGHMGATVGLLGRERFQLCIDRYCGAGQCLADLT